MFNSHSYIVIVLLAIIASISACSPNNTSNSNNLESKLDINTFQSSVKEDVNVSIPDGIYFSYKRCDLEENCKGFKPAEVKGIYYLPSNQDLNESMYYLLVKNNNYYIYSLQFLDEDLRAVGSWSQMHKIDSTDLSFRIKSIEQVIGSDYLARYDDSNLNNKLATSSNESGLLKIGSLVEGSELPTNETIRFIRTNDGYQVDCNNYIDEYEKVVDQLVKQNRAVGYHFYYECANRNSIFFRNVS